MAVGHGASGSHPAGNVGQRAVHDHGKIRTAGKDALHQLHCKKIIILILFWRVLPVSMN